MFQPLRGDVRRQLVRLDALRVGITVIAGVGDEGVRSGGHVCVDEIRFHLLQQRCHLLHIVGLLRDIGREDELRFIDQDLRVAALIPAFVRGLHDP